MTFRKLNISLFGNNNHYGEGVRGSRRLPIKERGCALNHNVGKFLNHKLEKSVT